MAKAINVYIALQIIWVFEIEIAVHVNNLSALNTDGLACRTTFLTLSAATWGKVRQQREEMNNNGADSAVYWIPVWMFLIVQLVQKTEV